MSIGIIAAADLPAWAWGIWLAAAAGVAWFVARRPRAVVALPMNGDSAAVETLRPLPYATPVAKDRATGPLLIVVGVIAFVIYLAVAATYFAIRQWTTQETTTQAGVSSVDLALVSLLPGLIAWAIAVAFLASAGVLPAIGYGRCRMGAGVRAGGAGAFVAIPVVALTLQATLWIWTAIGYTHPTQHALLSAMQEAPAAWVVVASVLSAVVTAPLFEELLFRGCLQTAVRRASGSSVVAVLTASVPFALIHETWTWPPIIVFAVMLGGVYERTRSLWATTVMHALFNGFSVAMSMLA